MNFIAATIELRSFISDPINAYGLDYRGADAVVPLVVGLQRSSFESSATTVKEPSFHSLKIGNPALEH